MGNNKSFETVQNSWLHEGLHLHVINVLTKTCFGEKHIERNYKNVGAVKHYWLAGWTTESERHYSRHLMIKTISLHLKISLEIMKSMIQNWLCSAFYTEQQVDRLLLIWNSQCIWHVFFWLIRNICILKCHWSACFYHLLNSFFSPQCLYLFASV